jgi:hypothetical protein
MAQGTIRVKGLRELDRAFRQLEGGIPKTTRNELAEVARPIADTAREKISQYRGAKLNTIRPRATGRSVFVTQAARKVTGKRADFGSLQMSHGMLPALDEYGDEIIRGLETELDRLASRLGF